MGDSRNPDSIETPEKERTRLSQEYQLVVEQIENHIGSIFALKKDIRNLQDQILERSKACPSCRTHSDDNTLDQLMIEEASKVCAMSLFRLTEDPQIISQHAERADFPDPAPNRGAEGMPYNLLHSHVVSSIVIARNWVAFVYRAVSTRSKCSSRSSYEMISQQSRLVRPNGDRFDGRISPGGIPSRGSQGLAYRFISCFTCLIISG